MAKAKQLPQEAEEMQGVETYALLTAEGIYKNYNLTFTKDEIRTHIHADQSFYKNILGLPARHLYNQILITHCKELEDFCQEDFIELKLYQLRKLEQQQAQPPSATNQSNVDDTVNKIEPDIHRHAEDLLNYERQASDERHRIREINTYYIEEWQSTQQRNAENITQTLREQGLDLDDDFTMRLYERLNHSAVAINLSDEICKRFKIKGDPDQVQKAVIATLIEGEV